MTTELFNRMTADLGMRKPSCVNVKQFQNMVFYSGAAQWVKTIITDVDPDTGDARLGVTMAYLQRRACAVITDLYKTLFQKDPDNQTIVHNIEWMLQTMLAIGELEQNGDFIVLPCPVSLRDNTGFSRVTGLRTLNDLATRAVGMCTYSKAREPEQDSVASLATALTLCEKHGISVPVLSRLRALTVCDLSHADVRPNKNAQLVTLHPDATQHEHLWCASHGWPLSNNWSSTAKWLCLREQ